MAGYIPRSWLAQDDDPRALDAFKWPMEPPTEPYMVVFSRDPTPQLKEQLEQLGDDGLLWPNQKYVVVEDEERQTIDDSTTGSLA